jgi:hypothetical protein
MAHYAWINKNNIVVNVTVGVDENLTQGDIGGSTEAWEQFYTQAINQDDIYVKRASYNSKIRYNYAGIGYTYDPEADAFIAPRPQCGHKELFLNDKFIWNCQGCDLEAKKLLDEA